jgi:PhnB protein
MSVRPIPHGYHSVTPYLVLRGARRAVEFYVRTFGATEILVLDAPDGSVLHAEIRIGDSVVMLADEVPDEGHVGPQTRGGTTGSLLLYVEDVDACFARAIAGGAKAVSEVSDQFYGDRTGSLLDPFGHMWTIATHVVDVSPEEMQQRLTGA